MLGPRSVGRCKREQAEMCVQAVLAVADLDRKDVNLDLIKASVSVAVSRHSFHACIATRQAPNTAVVIPAIGDATCLPTTAPTRGSCHMCTWQNRLHVFDKAHSRKGWRAAATPLNE